MDKKHIINSIADRIKSEYKKHKDLDWTYIAACKIYNSLIMKENNNTDINFEWNETINKLEKNQSIIDDDTLNNIINNIPQQQSQNKYNLNHQLIILYKIANKLKLYDAADFLKSDI